MLAQSAGETLACFFRLMVKGASVAKTRGLQLTPALPATGCVLEDNFLGSGVCIDFLFFFSNSHSILLSKYVT